MIKFSEIQNNIRYFYTNILSQVSSEPREISWNFVRFSFKCVSTGHIHYTFVVTNAITHNQSVFSRSLCQFLKFFFQQRAYEKRVVQTNKVTKNDSNRVIFIYNNFFVILIATSKHIGIKRQSNKILTLKLIQFFVVVSCKLLQYLLI